MTGFTNDPIIGRYAKKVNAYFFMSVFATCEMFMLPSIAMGLGKEKRFGFYVVVGVILVYFFWSKYHSVMMMFGEI